MPKEIEGKPESAVNNEADAVVFLPQDDSKSNQENSWFDKVQYFYQAPVVKFAHHLIFYTCFLLLMAYTLISQFYYERIEWNEMVVSIMVFGFIVQEIRQV